MTRLLLRPTEAIESLRPGSVVVVDYLQILDQRRDTPPLSQQVAQLKDFARQAGVIIICISQVDRRFDLSARAHPELRDVRLPNALDMGLFDKKVFLNDGTVTLDAA